MVNCRMGLPVWDCTTHLPVLESAPRGNVIMAKVKTFQRQALAALKANLPKTERLVELHKDILKSSTLDPEQRKTTRFGLEQNERAEQMYKELLRKFEGLA